MCNLQGLVNFFTLGCQPFDLARQVLILLCQAFQFSLTFIRLNSAENPLSQALTQDVLDVKDML